MRRKSGALRWWEFVCAVALTLCAAGPAAAGVTGATVFTDEGEFAVAVSGHTSVLEGFEDGLVWATSRSPEAVASVTSQGVTWTSNHPANEISTGSGAARSGNWGIYSNPHGDQSVPNVDDLIEDGFAGSSERSLTAIGGWFTGLFGSRIQLIVDGDEANPISLGPVDSFFRFFGVVVDGSFTTFEFREIEGTREDQKIIFADDFIIVPDALPVMTGVVAGVADVRGSEGSDWHTDLFVHNASAGDTLVELYFRPAGGAIGTPVTLTLGADRTELLEDAVSTVFGSSGSGAILWRVLTGDESRLLVSANTFNRVDDVKRYGQYVPGIRWDLVSPAGTSFFVPALAGFYRTNLGFSTDRDCNAVTIRAIDRSGVVSEERTIGVEPYSWQQLNQLFRREFPGLVADPDMATVADSLHRFEVVGVDGKIVAYSVVIGNITNDGSYMLGQSPGSKGERTWLPGSAVTGGVNDSQWKSDVMVFNTAGVSDSVTFTFFPSNADNSGDMDNMSLGLGSGEGLFQGNILSDLFALPSPAAGSLDVTASESLLWMRTYSEEPGEEGLLTYGLAIPPFGEQDMIVAGSEGRISGFTSNDSSRSNLILQNTLVDGAGVPMPVAVRVDVLDRQGVVVHQQSYDLRPGEYLQDNGFIDGYGLGWIVSGTLRLVVTGEPPEGATGGVAAMVSEINGAELPGTNDGRLIPAAVLVLP